MAKSSKIFIKKRKPRFLKRAILSKKNRDKFMLQEGIINHFNEAYKGIMPIRVLQHTLIHEFENMNPEFAELSKKVISELGLDPALRYDAFESNVQVPNVVFNKISVNESFLSYVWCVAFSLSVLYEEIIVKLSRNEYFGNDIENPDMEIATDAYKVWEYAISLLKSYSPWNVELPNPEVYKSRYNDIILRVNSLYITAMKFVLAHEFSHIELQHNERTDPAGDLNKQSIEFEKEADKRAIDLVLADQTPERLVTLRMGILIGLCSLLFFSSFTKGEAYPDTDERIDAIFKLINPAPQDAMWGIGCLAYKLWDRQFDKKLVWQEGLGASKNLYDSIKKQVEQLSNR